MTNKIDARISEKVNRLLMQLKPALGCSGSWRISSGVLAETISCLSSYSAAGERDSFPGEYGTERIMLRPKGQCL